MAVLFVRIFEGGGRSGTDTQSGMVGGGGVAVLFVRIFANVRGGGGRKPERGTQSGTGRRGRRGGDAFRENFRKCQGGGGGGGRNPERSTQSGTGSRG